MMQDARSTLHEQKSEIRNTKFETSSKCQFQILKTNSCFVFDSTFEVGCSTFIFSLVLCSPYSTTPSLLFFNPRSAICNPKSLCCPRRHLLPVVLEGFPFGRLKGDIIQVLSDRKFPVGMGRGNSSMNVVRGGVCRNIGKRDG